MDIKYLNILKVILLILTLSIIFITLYLTYHIKRKYQTSELFAVFNIIVIAILIISYVITTFIILPKLFQNVYCTITSDEIIINSGALIQKKTYIKITAVQYTTAIKVGFQSHIFMNILLITTFGRRHFLYGFSTKNMEDINNKIQKYLSERGGF